jgi:hypothetical protein
VILHRVVHHEADHHPDGGDSKHLWKASQFLSDYTAQYSSYFQINPVHALNKNLFNIYFNTNCTIYSQVSRDVSYVLIPDKKNCMHLSYQMLRVAVLWKVKLFLHVTFAFLSPPLFLNSHVVLFSLTNKINHGSILKRDIPAVRDTCIPLSCSRRTSRHRTSCCAMATYTSGSYEHMSSFFPAVIHFF